MNWMQAIAALISEPWFVANPESMQALLQQMTARVQGMGLEEIEARARADMGGDVQDDAPAGYVVEDGLAVLRLEGTMVPEANWLMKLFGMQGTNDLRSAVARAQEDASVRSLLVLANSPGGVVGGVRELHETIKNSSKPVHVHNTGTMASACYWALCGAGTVTAADTALTGSIGAMIALRDTSKMLQDMGVTVEVARSSALKGAPVSGEPVTKAAKAVLQDYVDDVAALFYDDVKASRGFDDKAWSALGDPGGVWSAAKAVGNGLLDSTLSLDAAKAAARIGGDRPIFATAPSSAPEGNTTMTKEEQERFDALEAQLKTQGEALAAAQAQTKAAEATAKAVEATAQAKAAEDLKTRKAGLIAKAKSEGKITAVNEAAIQGAAAVLDEAALTALLDSSPVLVKTEASAGVETGTPKSPDETPEEKALTAKVEGLLGMGSPEVEGTFSLANVGK